MLRTLPALGCALATLLVCVAPLGATEKSEGQEPSAASTAPASMAAPAAQTASPAAPSIIAATPLAEAMRAKLAEVWTGARAGEERQALATFYEATGYAALFMDGKGLPARGEKTVTELADAESWGLSAGELAVPEAKSPVAGAKDQAAAEVAIARAVLRYARQARGGRIDPLQLSNALDRKPTLLEPSAVLDGIAKAEAADDYLRSLHPQHAGFQRLRDVYAANLRQPKPDAALQRKLLLNMEQWRWMPDDLGAFHVVANVPEFMFRVVKDGKTVHSERMIAGLTDKQTPVFSAEMTMVTFHPQWGVPNSIKVKEILPGLLRGKSVMARNNLKIAMNGREIDPSQVDWTKADIRAYHVYQPGGGQNVLGLVKFSFPNKHDVYMHDTPTKNLFNSASRTFSHGCLRVRDPLKFASVILEQDKGWGMSRVTALAGPGGGQNNAVNLTRKIPVHVTYFTAVVDEAGKLHTYADPYGHENRIQMGLDGKAHLIAKTKQDLGAARAEVIARLGEARVTSEKADWRHKAFGDN
jgi:murein L,D-transpeptidase YcbB/YkuD